MSALERFVHGDQSLAEIAQTEEERAQHLPFTYEKLLDSSLLKVNHNKRLGKGNFGIVCSGDYQNRRVAVKMLIDAPDFDTLQAFFKELKIMDYVGKHENIVELIGAEVSNILSGKACAVLEFCSRGSLDQYLKNHRETVLPPCTAEDTDFSKSSNIFAEGTDLPKPFRNYETTLELLCRWCQQISCAMSFLASKGIVHGDLATRNVLISEDFIMKLADFGMSRNLYTSAMYVQRNKGRALPWCWLPPEVLEDQQFSIKSDVWSYGVTLWEVFEFAKIPYPNLTWDNQFVKNLKNGSLRLVKPELMPQKVYADVVLRCFETLPDRRIDFDSIEEYWVQYFTPVVVEANVGEGTSALQSSTAPNEVHMGHSQHVRRKLLLYRKKEQQIDYHRIPIETLYARYGSDPLQGLSNEQAKRNKKNLGKNTWTLPKQEPVRFIKTFCGSRFQLILLTSFILSFSMFSFQYFFGGEHLGFYLLSSSVLAGFVIGFGSFALVRERKYSRSDIRKSILKKIPTHGKCIRDGKLYRMETKKLVVGDIVKVKFGDTIPADIRIIEASRFKVDMSLITGESDPQLGTSECTSENPAETRNLAFFPATVLDGTAKGIVVSVGDDMFIGRASALASRLESRDSPLAKEVQQLAIWLLVTAVFFGVTFSVCTLELGYGFMNSAVFLINIIVANLPLGLSVTLTVALASTTRHTVKKNCLAKLGAVEALGSTTVMCFDKTGTLTRDWMTVNHLWFSNKIYEVAAGVQFDKRDGDFQALARAASLCTRAAFFKGQKGLPVEQRRVKGNGTEAAILRYLEELDGDIVQRRNRSPKVFEIPFTSENKWQLSIHETIVDGRKKNLLVMKGAPERIMSYCSKILVRQKEYQLNKNSDWWKDTFEYACEELGRNGERILGFCDLELPEEYPIGFQFTAENTEFLKLGLRFVGLISMADPLRASVVETVKSCRAAGIKVVMVTGDHSSTAKAIAKDVGIIYPEPVEERANDMNMVDLGVDADANEAVVVEGEELKKFSTEQLGEVLRNKKQVVFSRVSPQQKLLIVEGFQRLNEVVAMIGDGVNDAAALKKADVGVALGISGSEVSKEAANLILLDDNLLSIAAGVTAGRLMFENLKKSFRYLLSSNMALLIPSVLFVAFNIPLPLGTSHMLMLTLVTGLAPAISLLYEKPEGNLMKGPPRNLLRSILFTARLGVIQSGAGMFAYFVVMTNNGFLLWDLFGLRKSWDNRGINDLRDTYGQEWTYTDRKHLEHTCWTAYFCAVIVCRWGTLLVSRTIRFSMFSKILGNWMVIPAILDEAAIACLLAYTPGMDAAVSFFPLKFTWWLPGVPFCVFSILYGEIPNSSLHSGSVARKLKLKFIAKNVCLILLLVACTTGLATRLLHSIFFSKYRVTENDEEIESRI